MPDPDAPPRLRAAARAIVVDHQERILLLHAIAEDGVTVWLTPGGGLEPGESLLEALRRELVEEIGLRLTGEPPHVWHQRVVKPGHIDGYDGAVNDFFLVRTEAFAPRGTMTPEELRAELVHGHRWWTIDEIQTYVGDAVFAPRRLGELVPPLLRQGPPATPMTIGL
ncbi:MAG TPA: NUDIX domain-containing protein [Nocardioidaceae bacterium]|nr:NUDIX domain-containing protein [Nocardioidaceae bacterium]